MTQNPQPATSVCVLCHKPFDYTPVQNAAIKLAPTICDECALLEEAEHQARARVERLLEWKRICPLVYQETDLANPGLPASQKRGAVLDWAFGPKGLIIHGPSCQGKTRLTWLLVKRLMLEGHSVVAISGCGFADQCATENALGSGSQWRERLSGADVLFIDDFEKCKFTDRVESDLLDIVERRTSWGRPLLLTSNLTSRELVHILSIERGTPILRRIREFCIPVTL